jgi:hypothetical protein
LEKRKFWEVRRIFLSPIFFTVPLTFVIVVQFKVMDFFEIPDNEKFVSVIPILVPFILSFFAMGKKKVPVGIAKIVKKNEMKVKKRRKKKRNDREV